MRVLVLRPEPAASRTAGRLAALGHEAVLLPLTKAEHDVLSLGPLGGPERRQACECCYIGSGHSVTNNIQPSLMCETSQPSRTC